MKYFKYLLLLGSLSLLVNNSYSSSSVINSNRLIDYLKQKNTLNSVSRICSNNVCSDILVGNKEILIKKFIKSYVDKIKEENLEDGIKVELKGFPITRIFYEH